MSTLLEDRLGPPSALTYHANRVKGQGQQAGATVELALVEVGGQRRIIAGINSTARWTQAQRDLLATWGVTIVPRHLVGQLNLCEHGGGLHAEANMAIYLSQRRGRGLRWSCAVVGAHYDTRRGSRAYVCQNCRGLVRLVGGEIEPPL